MRGLISAAVGLFVLALAWPVNAQDEPGTIGRGFTVQVKVGHNAQFEEGVKQHMAWHGQQGDPWRWNTFVIQSGERLGQYFVGSGGHHWADFDALPVDEAADGADWVANIGDHIEWEGSDFSRFMPNASRPPADPEPMPLAEVLTYRIKQGHGPAFRHVLRRFTEAAEEIDWPNRYVWLQGLTGGPAGTYILILPLANWAALAPRSGVKSLREVMDDVLGVTEADSLRETLNAAVDSIQSEVWQYRPDLSYIP